VIARNLWIKITDLGPLTLIMLGVVLTLVWIAALIWISAKILSLI
jgi:hypothetical protein